MAEARTLANLQRMSDCAGGKLNSIIFYTADCDALIKYIDLAAVPKREVKSADVADKIVQMLDQTVTDRDALITQLLDIIKLLASRKT